MVGRPATKHAALTTLKGVPPGPVIIPSPRVAVVIPARNHARVITATIRAVADLAAVDLVVVVDDAAADDTAEVARRAGAVAVSHTRPAGAVAALETGAAAVAGFELGQLRPSPRHLLFVDADLGSVAAELAPVVLPILDGRADLCLPAYPAGERDRVVRLARHGIAKATGWGPTQPLARHRCLTRAAFEAARPLAAGVGAEVGQAIDLHRAGFRVVEVPVRLEPPPIAPLARGRRWAQVLAALARRGVAPSPRVILPRRP